jgi:hypothetical protein
MRHPGILIMIEAHAHQYHYQYREGSMLIICGLAVGTEHSQPRKGGRNHKVGKDLQNSSFRGILAFDRSRICSKTFRHALLL